MRRCSDFQGLSPQEQAEILNKMIKARINMWLAVRYVNINFISIRGFCIGGILLGAWVSILAREVNL